MALADQTLASPSLLMEVRHGMHEEQQKITFCKHHERIFRLRVEINSFDINNFDIFGDRDSHFVPFPSSGNAPHSMLNI